MNRLWKIRIGAFSLLLGLVLHAAPAFGCAACAGRSDGLQAQGMNWGIFTLLAVVGLVLGGVGSFFVYLARRAALTPGPPNGPLPPPTHPA